MIKTFDKTLAFRPLGRIDGIYTRCTFLHIDEHFCTCFIKENSPGKEKTIYKIFKEKIPGAIKRSFHKFRSSSSSQWFKSELSL